MSQDLTLLLWVIIALIWGGSIMFFARVTAKSINGKMKDLGAYAMSTEDKIGYSLFSIALAIVLPPALAQRFIPTGVLDTTVVRKYARYPRDQYFAILLFLTTVCFFAFIALGMWFS